jgi:hypothetical protein
MSARCIRRQCVSKWHRIEDIKDIEISQDGADLEVLIGQDYFGNVYVEIPIELIKKVLADAIPQAR